MEESEFSNEIREAIGLTDPKLKPHAISVSRTMEGSFVDVTFRRKLDHAEAVMVDTIIRRGWSE